MLGGHFFLALAGGVDAPFGSFEDDRTQSSVVSTGWTLGGDAGFGISRSVVVALAALYTNLENDDQCPGCDAQSVSVGPLLRYHLVQGLRFDPWMSVGASLRRTAIDNDATYLGVDWMSVRVGGDWYASPNVGFGPMLEVALGTFLDKSEGAFDGNVYGHLKIGTRVVFDVPGK